MSQVQTVEKLVALSSREQEQLELEREKHQRSQIVSEATENEHTNHELESVAMKWPAVRGTAELVKDYHQALIQAGFTREEAITLVGTTWQFLSNRLK